MLKNPQSVPSLRFYRLVSRVLRPAPYAGKLLLVTFACAQLPLLVFFAWALHISPMHLSASCFLLAACFVALAGGGITWLALNALLQPLHATYAALRAYWTEQEAPALPTEFTDEAGRLMAETQQALDRLGTLISRLSYYDGVTGLPNRLLFEERLMQAISAVRRQGGALAVLLMEIPSLHEIAEVYGHEIGDLVLQSLTDRVGRQVRESDVFARLGDEGFALLQTNLPAPEAAAVQAQRLLDAICGQPFVLGGHEINVRAAIGIATFPGDGSAPEDLLRDAEAARHEAREQKTPGAFCFYDAGMNIRLRRNLELEAGLRSALEHDDLQLYYQPQISNLSGEIVGVEALLRWTHPTHGPIAPSEFIPLAEKNDLILHLGEWVLRSACQQNKAWQEAGLPLLRVAVNLSTRQFQQPDLVERVAAALAETGLEARWLELEMTESIAVEDPRHVIAVLERLRALGITLSLDDFGTGYSSLSQLKSLPIDTLKIDRAFVENVMDSAENASFTEAIISLADSLNLDVIVEGVETNAQFEFLKANCSGLSQGYFFSAPIPACEMEVLLRHGLTSASRV